MVSALGLINRVTEHVRILSHSVLGFCVNFALFAFRRPSQAVLVVVKDALSEDYGRLIAGNLAGCEVKIVHMRRPKGCAERGCISIGEALLTDWAAILFPSHCLAAIFSSRSRKIFVGHGIYTGKVINGMADYVYGFKSRLVISGCCYDQMIVTSRGEERIAMDMSPAFAGRLVFCQDPVLERLQMLVSKREPSRRQRIFVASSWGQYALFGTDADIDRIFDQLKLLCRRYDVMLSYHSRLQVGTVFAGRLRQFQADGGRIFTDRLNWTDALAAADLVICDHSSVAMYAALLGKRLLIVGPLRARFHPRAPIRAVIEKSAKVADVCNLEQAVDAAWQHDLAPLSEHLKGEIPELTTLSAIVLRAEGDLSRSRPLLVH